MYIKICYFFFISFFFSIFSCFFSHLFLPQTDFVIHHKMLPLFHCFHSIFNYPSTNIHKVNPAIHMNHHHCSVCVCVLAFSIYMLSSLFHTHRYMLCLNICFIHFLVLSTFVLSSSSSIVILHATQCLHIQIPRNPNIS